MKPASEIISRPILTEKASGLAEANKYVFEILPGCDRAQVKTGVVHLGIGAFHRAQAQRSSLVYVYPKEGIAAFIDNFAIPKGASNVAEAHVFINWMMQPENIAAASNFAKYNNAVAGAEKFMDKELFDDPAINTPADKLDRLRPFQLCSPKALKLRSAVWTKLKK